MVCGPEDKSGRSEVSVHLWSKRLQINAETDEQRDTKLKKKTDNSAMNMSSSYSGDQFTPQSMSG